MFNLYLDVNQNVKLVQRHNVAGGRGRESKAKGVSEGQEGAGGERGKASIYPSFVFGIQILAHISCHSTIQSINLHLLNGVMNAVYVTCVRKRAHAVLTLSLSMYFSQSITAYRLRSLRSPVE